jgi:DNA-binding GntR family transcriptional regulator
VADPMYRQIADDLRSRIEAGELEPGSQLPTENDLQEHYGASRNTVRDAIKWLITGVLVETRPGQGTFVTERPTPFVTTLTGHPEGGDEDVYLAEVVAYSRTPEVSKLKVEIQQADRGIANALHIAEGVDVVSRHQQRFIDGTPWSLQTSFYPMSLVDSGAARLIQSSSIKGGAVAYLAQECGIKQVGYRDSIAVRPPDETEIGFFKIPGDGRVSVFELFRIGFNEMGERVRLTITVYPTDRNRFVINVGNTPPPNVEDAPPE